MVDPNVTPDRAATREEKIAAVIERWMRSDGFAFRYAAEILRNEDTTALAAADCASFVEDMLATPDRAATETPEYYEPDWPRCGARSGETRILCQRPKGHDGPHRNGAAKWETR